MQREGYFTASLLPISQGGPIGIRLVTDGQCRHCVDALVAPQVSQAVRAGILVGDMLVAVNDGKKGDAPVTGWDQPQLLQYLQSRLGADQGSSRRKVAVNRSAHRKVAVVSTPNPPAPVCTPESQEHASPFPW